MTQWLKSLNILALIGLLWLNAFPQERIKFPDPVVFRGDVEGRVPKDILRHMKLESITDVWCYDLKTDSKWSGTAWLAKPGVWVTAYHVAEGTDYCKINGVKAKVLVSKSSRDYLILSAPSNGLSPLQYTCKDFNVGSSYFALGSIASILTVTTVTATNIIAAPANNKVNNFMGSRWLLGPIYHGMSGGPIMNSRGLVYGVNTATVAPSPYSFSQPLKNSPLCGKSK